MGEQLVNKNIQHREKKTIKTLKNNKNKKKQQKKHQIKQHRKNVCLLIKKKHKT